MLKKLLPCLLLFCLLTNANANPAGSYSCQWRAEDPASPGTYQEEGLEVSLTISASERGLSGILGWDRSVDAELEGKIEGTNLRFEAHHQLWNKPGRLSLSGKNQLVGLLDQVEREGKPWSARLKCNRLDTRPVLDKNRQFTECFDAVDELKLFLRDYFMSRGEIFPDKESAFRDPGLHRQIKTWLEESCQNWTWQGTLNSGKPSYLIKAQPRRNPACTIILSTSRPTLDQEGCPDYMELY